MSMDQPQPAPAAQDVDPATCRHLDVTETISENHDELRTDCQTCGDWWVEQLSGDERDVREEASYWREGWDEAR
jgi:hypothetical protein